MQRRGSGLLAVAITSVGLLSGACGQRDSAATEEHERAAAAEHSPPGPGPAAPAEPAPEQANTAPAPPPAAGAPEPPAAVAPNRPLHWPCARARATSTGEPGGRSTFEYAARASCTTPVELLLVGCPSRELAFLPAGTPDAESAFTYDDAGKLISVVVTSPRTGETVERITVEHDPSGRPARVIRQIGDRTFTTTYAWQNRRLLVDPGDSPQTYGLDREGRVVSNEYRTAEGGMVRERWHYEGDRLVRIEISAPGAEAPATITFDYECR